MTIFDQKLSVSTNSTFLFAKMYMHKAEWQTYKAIKAIFDM